jgi:hypothetical protein
MITPTTHTTNRPTKTISAMRKYFCFFRPILLNKLLSSAGLLKLADEMGGAGVDEFNLN